MAVPMWLQAMLLGLIQGLTEFIPVSSSGHLVLVPHLLGWERPGLAFDIALHLGTAAAIVVYFRTELLGMIRGVVLGSRTPDGPLYRRLALLLVLASIPIAVVGLAFEDAVAEVFSQPLAACGFLLVTAAILVGGERFRSRRAVGASIRPVEVDDPGTRLQRGADPADPQGLALDRIRPRHALVVGAAQMLALFPGVSRSGSSIMAGVFAGLTREAATRFSFLLALPAMVGAGILGLGDLGDTGIYSGPDIVLGVATAGVSGYLAIRFLVALVSRARLTAFAVYVTAFALVAGTVLVLRG